jgi:hypothetical protein
MSNAIKPRFSVDLDEIERQLSDATRVPVAPVRPEPLRPVPSHPAPAGRGDPLAELARIVGQDDPFGNLFTEDKSARPRPKIPTYGEAHPEPNGRSPAPARKPAPADDYPEPLSQSPQDLDGYAAPEPEARDLYADHGHDSYADQDGQAPGREAHYAPRRSRKALVAVVSVVGAAALGVGAALTLGGKSASTSGGEPPLVHASTDPVKVQPQSPGGVEIPNQNKQIYERAAQDGKTKVVNREEQPVDLRQATRVVPPSPDTTATVGPSAPAQGSALGLGEPKRVRTLTIRPDGTVVGAPSAPPAVAAPTVTASAAPMAPVAAPTPAAPSRAVAATPSTALSRPPVATPSAPTGGASPQAAAPATPAQPPAAQPAPQRVASVAPASAPVPAATDAPIGGFSVQIGVRPSESEARAAFAQMQQKYAALGGQPALIRKAEVNGNTLYRVRVGPLSKEDASSLCAKLQGSGGQCFVTKN